MMMVDTELRKSAIHGVGVFLTEPVAKQALVWQFDSRIDRVYCEEEVASLSGRTQTFLQIYSTWHEGVKLWVLCGDNGRHFNHSDVPNTISDGTAFGTDVAAFDLPAGTELTSDYRTICDAVRNGGMSF
ncbi:SET domain-containing protein-lysine N-methyltransferase [Sphingomonas antarctica]|uniref:SET domain-containing protein n=1 Tax=Sphingomonas antarctica TaxID=2040274 RepID=UPI0039ED9B8E